MNFEMYRLAAAVFDGFEDVKEWLESQGPTPDVHRVEDMIWPRSGLDANLEAKLDHIALNEMQQGIVWTGIERRCLEVTREQPPLRSRDRQRWYRDFLKSDQAASVWSHNASLATAWAERDFEKPFSYMGEEGGWQELKQEIPILPECGVYCPRRALDVILGLKMPEGELEPRAAAEIQAFLRLVGLLPKDEAVEARVFLYMRLDLGPRDTSDLSPQTTEGFRKMYELATEEERVLLFHRAFLPDDVGW